MHRQFMQIHRLRQLLVPFTRIVRAVAPGIQLRLVRTSGPELKTDPLLQTGRSGGGQHSTRTHLRASAADAAGREVVGGAPPGPLARD